MYGKIFESIYDGTLAEDWRALITFQQMIILCDAEGIIDMTPTAIARRTGIPIEHIESGIKILENPDPYSRSPKKDGRRIERLDEHRAWGWSIVNHESYRNIKSVEEIREYKRKKQREYREKSIKNKNHVETNINNIQHQSTNSTPVSVYVSLYKNVSAEIWKEFEQHRKEIKKPLTDLSRKKNLAILNKLTYEQQHEVVDKTIANRWTGLFLPKETEVIPKYDPAKGAI